jgi:hypothetical protein
MDLYHAAADVFRVDLSRCLTYICPSSQTSSEGYALLKPNSAY